MAVLIEALEQIRTLATNIALWSGGTVLTLGLLIRIANYFDRKPPHSSQSIVKVSYHTNSLFEHYQTILPLLPQPLCEQLRSLLSFAQTLLIQLSNRPSSQQQLQWTDHQNQIRQLIGTFLPSLLTTYLAVPSHLRTSPHLEELTAQISAIQNRLTIFQQQSNHQQLNQLTVQHETLTQYLQITDSLAAAFPLAEPVEAARAAPSTTTPIHPSTTSNTLKTKKSYKNRSSSFC